jgi:phage terminase large subunit-like protein
LIVPSGEGQGRAFRLREWQKRFICDIYSPHIVRNGAWRRRVRRAVLSIARKNGKTALIAALVLVHLVGPESVQNGEIYSAANDREQAAQVFKVVAQMVRADAELADMLKVVDSTKTVACFANGSFYKAMSAEAGTKHGLNPTVVIYDELAQARNRELYDVLDTSMGAREEPLFVTISTQSNDPQHILSQLIDDGLRANDPTIVVHLYAVPDDVPDIYDESCWALANPALGDFRSLEEMRAMAARAQRLPSFEAPFCNLYLNQRVDAQSPLIPRSEWMACQVENTLELGEEIYAALDLSGTTDLSALVGVSAERGDRTKAWFWKPKELIQIHSDRDRAPYGDWVEAGHIEATPGRSIDYGFVAERIAEIRTDYKIRGLAFDRWRIELLLREFNAIGLEAYVEGKDKPRPGALRLVPWGQGFKDMGPAIDALEVSVLERKFAHDGNPVQTFCFSNAVAISDPAGNRKMDKSKIRFRIDGAVSAAMAVGLKAADSAKPVGPSVYETRGVLSL